MEQTWTDKLSMKALGIAEGMAKGFHAQPKPSDNPFKAMPSMHRLLNVVGMVGGFAAVQYISNIIFACKINGSNCEEIPVEKVPKPLRFLHGILEYNPFSDAPRDQWLKVAHQMLPAMGGAIGAMKGSDMFFKHLNEREKDFNKWMKKDKLNPLEANAAASYVQGKAWRVMAGLTAWFSAASGLTTLYGIALNKSFELCNGAKISGFLKKLSNNHSDLGLGPDKGIPEVLKGTQTLINDLAQYPARGAELMEGFAKRLLGHMEPFGTLSDKQRLDIVTKIQKTIEHHSSKSTAAELQKTLDSNVLEMLKHADMKDFRPGRNGFLAEIISEVLRYPKKKLADIFARTEHSPSPDFAR